MIRALGIDVVDIDRFRRVVERWQDRFLEKILTPLELDYCRNKADALPSMAARFAAKEAFIKCLSEQEHRHFSWHSVQVANAVNGKPDLIVQEPLKTLLNVDRIHLSLSHSHRTAIATVILETAE